MKKYYLLLLFFLFTAHNFFAQTTETFETEAEASTSFTDNGQTFTITSNVGVFDMHTTDPGTGWSGTAIDNYYIDNSGGSAIPAGGKQFTISKSTPFTLKSVWLYLAVSTPSLLSLITNGTCSIEGINNGVSQFTVSKSSPFNTSPGVSNGFTLFDLANLQGDHSNVSITSFVITTTGDVNYIALDAMRWQGAAGVISTSGTLSNFTTCLGTASGSQSFLASGTGLTGNITVTAPTGYEVSTSSGGTYTTSLTLTHSGGVVSSTSIYVRLSASATGNPGGNVSLASSGATTKTVAVTSTITTVTATKSQTPVSCNGGNNGTATVVPSGGTAPYTYLWAPSGGATNTATGLASGTYTVTIKDANQCESVQTFTIVDPPLLTLSQGTVNHPSCFNGSNGSATVVVSGGTPPYSYDWNGTPIGDGTGTISGLAQGTYVVTVRDSKLCEATQSFTIIQPTQLTATASQVDVLCNGSSTGSATVVPSGGTGAYTYSWLPSGGTAATASGLAAGTYVVTIKDANLCQITRSFTITQPSAFVASQGTITHVNCRGEATGSATVNVTGGTGTYTYSWAPSGGTATTATGLSAGTYIVTITDANLCQTTQSFTINQPAAILAATTASIGVACFGGSNGVASVTTSGGTSPYTYLWAPSGGTASIASGLSAGNYTCTVTDAKGCTLVKNITINTPSAFSSTVSKTDVSCNGGTNGSASVTVSGATAPYTYTWSPSGGNAASATGLPAGNYTLTVEDANSCIHTVNLTINEPEALTAMQFHTDMLCAGQSNGTASVSIDGGTPPYTYIWSPSGGTSGTATGLANGNYSCLITDSKGCTLTKNFTITQPAPLTATTSQANATCITSGQASVNVSGGTTPYIYVWIPSGGTGATATGLTAGNYTCMISDNNGCTINKNFTITSTNTLTATQSKTDILCNSSNTGTATVVPAGAPGPYTYVWAPSGGNASTATGLTAGNYNVTITASNGCSIVRNFTINQPSALVVTPSQTSITCNGGNNGTASVTVSGGTGAYTYLWAPSGGTAATASGISAGNYTVTIKDANLCETTQSFTITQPDALVASAGTQNNVLCNGGNNGNATVNVTGGTGAYTYLWLPSGGTAATASGLAPGTYTVTVNDANLCQATQAFTITEPAVLTATTAQTDVLCNGGNNGTASVTVSGGTTPYTYVWSPSGDTASSATGLTVGNYSVVITDANGCTLTKNFTIAEPPALTATTSQTDLICNGGNNGTASVIISGGTGAYTYIWSPSGGTAATATGLTAGSYSVLITDANGCTLTKNFTIAEPPALTATTSQTDVSCSGGSNGSATVTASGGTPGYTYLWAPSGGTSATATGLAAGNYTCTITDANTCSIVKNITITVPSVLDAATTQTDGLCSGGNGSASVVPSGGTAPYTYAWSPSGGTAATATNLPGGNYTVLITDAHGCTVTKSFTITTAPALTATTTQTNILCFGTATGSATVNVSGGTGPYTYSWSPSGGTAATATGLVAGTYVCTITDANGCTLTQSFTITQLDALTLNESSTNITCNGSANGTASVAVSGGIAPYTYIWAPSGATSSTISGLSAGNYTCTVTDANGCIATKVITIYQQDPISVTSVKTDLLCHNAANGTATVTATGGVPNYIYQWAPYGGFNATATNLTAGTYTVTVTDALGCYAIHTITISAPDQLDVDVTQTDITCFGSNNGSIAVEVSGGVGPYTYAWTPSGSTETSITGLGVGNYSISITDANGCMAIRNFSLSQPAQLTASITKTDVGCFGGNDGTALAVVTGGTPPYSYSWVAPGGGTPNPANLVAGTYTVTITDANGCSFTGSITINQPLLAVVNSQPQNVTISAGGNATYTVGAINAASYQWQISEDSTNWTNITDGGTSNPIYSGSITNSLTITSVPFSHNGFLYRVLVMYGADCSIISEEAVLVVSDISGTSTFGNIDLNIYPNPATTKVFIKIPDFANHNNMKVTIYDLNGRVIKTSYITAELESIEVTGLESGMYIFNITSDAGQASRRIMIDKKS